MRLCVVSVSEVQVLVEVGLNFVSERNCVVVRRGGEQREENDWSVTQVNSIRPVVVASLLARGEAQYACPERGVSEGTRKTR